MGRPKGSLNKTTMAAKEAIQAAFDAMGGIDALVKWAAKEKNQSLFYSSVYTKLLPLDLKHSGDVISRVVLVELPKKAPL